MAESNPKKDTKFMPSNLLKDINKKNKKGNKKRSRQNPNDMKLPQTPQLPIAKVNLPWIKEPIAMRILMFYHSKPHIFGCQFSNLFYTPIKINTRCLVPTADKTKQTIMRYQIANIDEKQPNIEDFLSSESVFQAAKAEHKVDALFVKCLSPGDAARAGQSRLKMSNGLANKYKKLGGNPYKIAHNNWQFRKDNKRYHVRANWHIYKIEIMNHALRVKFETYYNLIKEYVDSKVPIYFVEHTKNDNQWADGEDGKGTNYLGKLLTALCCELRLRKEREHNDGNEAEKKENNEDGKDIKWSIDTMSDEFLNWMKVDNMDVMVDGAQFYKEHAKCPWLQ